jgi:hypothetical protein
MIALIITLVRLIRSVWKGLHDPEFRSLLFLVAILLVTGVLFYANVEGWSVLDSLYFSLVTLTTVGYGDLAPTTVASKVFTMVYLVVGIGVLLGFVSKVAGNMMADRQALRRRLRPDPGSRQAEAEKSR